MELDDRICDLFRYIKEKLDTKVTLKVEEKIELKDSKLGSEIEYYRKKKHLTQQQLADRLNISRWSIMKYENTENQNKINSKLLSRLFYELEIPEKVII